MKTKLIQKIKEELNRHLEAFEFRFSKEKVLFKKSVVKRMIKVSGEELIKLSEKAISQSKEDTIKQYSSVRNKLVDMYRKRKGITIPNELAELALRLVEKKTKQELIEEILKQVKKEWKWAKDNGAPEQNFEMIINMLTPIKLSNK